MLEVKWVGFDYGQCIMEPGGLRNHLVIGDICKLLGQPELIDERIYRYHQLNEQYGGYSKIKEGHRDEIYEYVLDGDSRAQELFGQKEQQYLDVGDGLIETLDWLQDQGFVLEVVSEMKKTLGAVGSDVVIRFLKTRGFTKYFPVIINPQGKYDMIEDALVDDRYVGKTKQGGDIYDVLAEDLRSRGIEPEEAVMVGDKPATDINPAHARGFKTIQYKGFIDLGPSDADIIINHFSELKEVLKKKE
ncbi:MAG: HAD family hydrolase [Actinobacteria bacterium]|nr:HAD family hydrolase [Actinomycetota bacterium]